MKGFMKKCKRALVVALSIALVGNSVDLSLLTVQAENEQGVVETVSADEVSNGEQQVYTVEEYLDVISTETSVTPFGFFGLADAAVGITGTPEEKWIDRLDLSHDTEGITRKVYDSLVEWTDNDGVEDYLITGELDSFLVDTQTGTVTAEKDANALAAELFANYQGYVRAAFDAFDRDYPEVFWLSGETMNSWDGTISGNQATLNYYVVLNNTSGFDMRADGYQNADTIKSAISTMNSLADTLVSGGAGKSTVDKIKYYNEQLTKKNEYNTSSNLNAIAHECRECIGALQGNTGTVGPVCEGYARAIKVLCDKSGIPCVLVDGDAGGAHMWNYVQVAGNWYAVDVTWNDPAIENVSGAVSGYENENYLLIGSETVVGGNAFGASRTVQNCASIGGVSFINGPVLSTGAYVNAVAEVTTAAGVTTQYDSVDGAFLIAVSNTNSTLKLLQDVAWTDKSDVTNTITIDLNGHTWDTSSESSYLEVAAAGKLTIKDSSAAGTGKITGKVVNNGTFTLISGAIVNAEATAVENNGSFVMEGGTIEGNTGVFVDVNGTFSMNDGVIQNGMIGVNIEEDATFTMNGGTLQNFTGTSIETGMGVVNDGTFTMSGGTIRNCSSTGVKGGLNTGGTFIMSGGTIKECDYTGVLGMTKVTLTGGSINGDVHGIRACDALDMSGDVTINGAVDIYMFEDATITVNGALTGSDTYSVKLLTNVAEDSPSVMTTGVFATGSAVNAAKFTAVEESQEVSLLSSTQLQLTFKTGTLSGVVNWEDQENQDGIRPESVTLQLVADGTAVGGKSATATADNNWAYSFEDVVLYDADGEIVYTVEAQEVEGYVATIDGYAEVTYTHGIETRNVSVEVAWDDEDAMYWERPTGVTIKLYADDVEVAELEASVDNEWKVSFSDLVKFRNGVEISYTLEVSDYETEAYGGCSAIITGSAQEGYTITMTPPHVHFWTYSHPVVDGVEQRNVLEAHCTNTGSECTIENGYGGKLTLILPENAVYGPGTHPATYTNELNTGHTIDPIIYSWSDGTMEEPEPLNAGTYHVVLSITDQYGAPATDEYGYPATAEGDFVISPASVSAVILGETEYYYTSEAVEPEIVAVRMEDGTEVSGPMGDLTVSYENNINVGENTAIVKVTGTGNYTGVATENFTIQYMDVTPLYNGIAESASWYTGDVVISAEGFTVKVAGEAAYSEAVTISQEGTDVSKALIFKQNETGYLSDEIIVTVNIDKVAPTFAEGQGISIDDDFWNTLLNKITFGTFFKETKTVTITGTDSGSGIKEYYYYLDKSGSETVMTSEQLENCTFALAENGEFNIDAESKYVIYAYARDIAGNRSDYICSDGVVIDTTAPLITVIAPSKDAGTLTDTGAEFTVQVNENGKVGLLWMLYANASTYTPEDAKISVPEWREVQAGENMVFTLGNLMANTQYGYLFVVCDDAGNISVYGEAGDAVNTYDVKAFTTTKTIPVFDTIPTINGTYGQMLSEMTLSGDATSNNGANGTWAIAGEDASKMPEAGTQDSYKVIFTPSGENADDFESVTLEVVPVVAKRPITVTMDSKTKKYGEENPAPTYSITAGTLVGTDSVEALGVEGTIEADKSSYVGSYSIIGTASSSNYEVTIVDGTLTIEKANAEEVSISKKYPYHKENAGNVGFADFVPADGGNVSFQLGTSTGDCTFSVSPSISGAVLSYTLNPGNINDSSVLEVIVTSENYEDYTIRITITLVDRTPVALKSGYEVSLKNSELTYGEALFKLIFEEAVFVVEGTTEEVAGSLTWEISELVPDVTTTKAVWVFTPENDEYMTVFGELSFVVNRATQPAFHIVPVDDVEFYPGKGITLQTSGGIDGGTVTYSAPVNNGVAEVTADGTVSIIGAGTVSITAVKTEASGNYLDATDTFTLTVLPAGLHAASVSWENGFSGEVTYDGQAQMPDVKVEFAEGALAEGTDYVLSYVNNVNAYGLSETEADFDSAKAPAVVITGQGNYTGVVNKYFVINKRNVQLAVADDKQTYNKTFGDAVFLLEGITTDSDGALTYAVSDENIISVNADGYVTINGVGSATITVSVAETNNCNAAADVKIAVTVEKAVYEPQQVERAYAYNKSNSEALDLSAYVPVDAGQVSYQLQSVSGEVAYEAEPVISSAGVLSYTLSKGVKNQSGVVTVNVSSDNYETYVITVNISLPHEVVVALKSGEQVKSSGQLIYGDKLGKLGFAEVVFVEAGTAIPVEGTLAWVNPELVPDVVTSSVQWVFTPDNPDYAPVYGTASMVVKKAVQPEFKIVPVTGVIYGDAVSLQTAGGLDSSMVEMTVPAQNGVLSSLIRNGEVFGATAIGAGKVTVSAVCKDTTGNYEDAVATYELIVVPKTLESTWISWADGFEGAETYTGNAITPKVKLSFDSEELAENVDYTVSYANNVNAYTVTSGDAGFAPEKAPVVIVSGKGNFAGSVASYFVINKAEKAPNMPASTRTVGYSIDVTGKVSLPESWIWQNEQLALAEGAETIAVAVYNGADCGNYLQETIEVTITRMQQGIPYVSEINGEGMEVIVNGWDAVMNSVEEAQSGDEIVVEMNGAVLLPGDIVEKLADEKATLVLDMGNNITWTIDGSSITTEDIADINMQVELNTANIPAGIAGEVIGDGYGVQMSLAHDGDFGFTALLTINLSAEKAGDYAKLYYFNEVTQTLEFICEDVIDAEGNVELTFTHASEYVIVVDEQQYEEPSTGGSSDDDKTDTPKENPVVKSPKTGDETHYWMILLICTCMWVFATCSVWDKGRRKEK